ncbi:RNA polymerase sigma factor [Desulfoscipio gibsoniae]|uniref:RNA polymerase sigma factor, sigma-70 family n=1 Tax=Desulfoscipio gibsoniae DSM 7213 TaxID=767817 RepID=R4KDP4_9FIRM|nr:RNA polymerase sigma factor [Desulfoscipio gibsoniae]AGK99806.1 RNA polymerase sigma factor, sigma-70 family [Desulfoscipio gibsoniae DSM 7213]
MADKLAELFDRLYCDNQAKVYKLALGLTGNANDAEDITQEAFFRAFRFYHTFREESSFFTWIYRITLNVANDYLKQRAKLRIYELTEDLGYSIEEIIDPNPANDPETELLAREVKYRCLHGFTECLPNNQRKVFCLAVTIGLPHKLVAEILDCSVSSVKTTLHRAKKRIAGYLEKRCQLIKKSNPCNCNQWVRYGLQQGWITKQALVNPRPEIIIKAREEMVELRSLRYTYQKLYRETADESLAQRIREGIKNKEWAIFS